MMYLLNYEATTLSVVAAYSFSSLASVKPIFITIAFGIQLHVKGGTYVTAASTSTFVGTVHNDCMYCNHVIFLQVA